MKNFTDAERKKFEEKVKPAIEWLNNNCHPHTSITITHTKAELKEGKLVISTDEFLKD